MLISNSKNLFVKTSLKTTSTHNINSNQAKKDSVTFTSSQSDKKGPILKGLGLAALCVAEFIALKSNVTINNKGNTDTQKDTVAVVDLSDMQPQITNTEKEATPVLASPPAIPEIAATSTIAPREIAQYGNIKHIKYDEAPQSELISIGSGIEVRKTAAEAYRKMVLAAQNDGVSIIPLSGFRSVNIQNQLFYDVARERGQTPAQRATVSAPPGFSEHHTGYAIDVGDGNNSSGDLSTSFEQTNASRWLRQNMSNYGFELSFPRNNAQNINYEPWHLRFVGDQPSQTEFEFARSLSQH